MVQIPSPQPTQKGTQEGAFFALVMGTRFALHNLRVMPTSVARWDSEANRCRWHVFASGVAPCGRLARSDNPEVTNNTSSNSPQIIGQEHVVQIPFFHPPNKRKQSIRTAFFFLYHSPNIASSTSLRDGNVKSGLSFSSAASTSVRWVSPERTSTEHTPKLLPRAISV